MAFRIPKSVPGPHPVAGLLVVLAIVTPAAPAPAATFIVDHPSDTPDLAPGDGLCETAGGFCTLRAAIEESNDNVFSADTIRFDFPGAPILVPSTELPTIAGALTILGPGPDALTLDAAGLGRALVVNTGPGGERQVTIRGLTVVGATSGGLDFAGAALVARLSDCVVKLNLGGGGIVVSTDATLTVERCEIIGNTSSASGGGIRLQSGVDVTVCDSTIAGNDSDQNGGGVSVFGSSLSDPVTTLRLENVTITGNTAARAGGVVLLNAAQAPTVTVVASTIASNVGAALSGGVDVIDGTLVIGNTIVASNQSPFADDCLAGSPSANVVSLGGNVIGVVDPAASFQCPFVDGVVGDQVGSPTAVIDPMLGPLADYGGPTRTMKPLAGSPTIDRGLGGEPCPNLDQRGAPRPFDGDGDMQADCDVGAVEVGAFAALVFADDFEGGSTSAWSAAMP